MSYSQHPAEEDAILHLLGEAKGKALDIGAWCATVFSNTRALYERGWELVLVEPSPGPFMRLMQTCRHCGAVNDPGSGSRAKPSPCECPASPPDRFERYSEDPRVTLVLAAVGPQSQFVRFHATDDALSTTDDRYASRWGDRGGYYGTFHTQMTTIEALWQHLGPFDFVNLDVEGMGAETLAAWPLDRVRPRGICVEYLLGERDDFVNRMKSFGYAEVFASKGNLLFGLQCGCSSTPATLTRLNPLWFTELPA